jgi:hypothetical protein
VGVLNVKALVEKEKKKTKVSPQDTIEKVLKCRYLKCTHNVHFDLKCMSYDQKKANSQIGNLIIDHKFSTAGGQMISNWDVLYTVGKMFYWVIRYCLRMIQKNCYEEDMNVQSFKTPKVPILGLPLGSLGKKCHLDVAHVESHKIYYREGSGAFF